MPIYIKLDGIDGEVTAKGFEKWIEVLSFSWGVTQSSTIASGGGAGAGKASFQDLHFQKKTDQASPNIFLAAATGKHISFAEMDFIKAESQSPYLKIRVEDVIVTSLEEAGAEGADNDVPSDDVSLAYAKVEMAFTPQNPDGSLGQVIDTQFDLLRNAAG